jgi:galactokinase/mevalonate kinase-like predicted kinase
MDTAQKNDTIESTRQASASAPARCGILGNPSDIYGGKVLSCSVPSRARCTVRMAEENRLPEDLRLWNAATKRFPLDHPVQVVWSTEIPRSSGLSGSTALLAATLAAVLELRGASPALSSRQDRTSFAELLRDVERHDADVMCGYQDAYMISHGGLQLMDFKGKHPVDPGPPATLRALFSPLPFLLITTGVERLSGSVHGPMSNRWIAGDPVVRDGIRRISELAEPGADLLLEGDWAAFGELMDENQRWIAAMGGSGDAVDQLIAKAKAHGALGAKLAGAGMGGTIIALTEHPDQLEKNLRAEGYTRFLRPEILPGVSFDHADDLT